MGRPLLWSLVVLGGTAAAVAGQQPTRRQIVQVGHAANRPFSPAVKAGGFVYASGVIAEDTSVDIKVQTRQVLERLGQVLEAGGSSLGNVASTTVYLKTVGDFAAVDEVYRGFFERAPPARTTMMTNMLRPEALIEISAVGIPNGGERVVVLPEGWTRPSNPYSYGIKSGDTLFLSGLVSRSGATDEVVEGDIATQVNTVMANAQAILGAAGMSLGDTVSSRVALRDIAEFQQMNEVYRSHWEKDRPTRATVQAGLLGNYGVKITFVAVRGTQPREVIIPPRPDGTPGQAGSNFSPAIRVGNRLWVSGMTGSTDANRGDVKAQTTETLRRLGRALEAAGFSFKDVVESTVWLTDATTATAMNETYRAVFPSDPPARATVEVGSLAGDTVLIEIALVAAK